jgi:hypothetical protein
MHSITTTNMQTSNFAQRHPVQVFVATALVIATFVSAIFAIFGFIPVLLPVGLGTAFVFSILVMKAKNAQDRVNELERQNTRDSKRIQEMIQVAAGTTESTSQQIELLKTQNARMVAQLEGAQLNETKLNEQILKNMDTLTKLQQELQTEKDKNRTIEEDLNRTHNFEIQELQNKHQQELEFNRRQNEPEKRKSI